MIRIVGGKTLEGMVKIAGSKLVAQRLLPLTLLQPRQWIFDNVPDITDIRYILNILEYLGARVSYTKVS